MWELITRKCRFDYQLQITNYSIVWHLPPLAEPGPCRLAIQLALLSSFNCLSSLPATSLRRAASLAWGEITPTREIRHWACALAMQVLSNLLYWLTMTLNCPSSSGLPVERQRCSTLLSAQNMFSSLQMRNTIGLSDLDLKALFRPHIFSTRSCAALRPYGRRT